MAIKIMIKNDKNKNYLAFTRVAICAAAAAFALSSCASDDAATPEPETAAAAAEPVPPAAPGPMSAGAPRFTVPSAGGQSPPSVNTVPTEAPTPKSTEAEREETRKGLIADLTNARHSEQGGRTQPVVVRPYVETAASDQPAAPTAPEIGPGAATTDRLDAPPPPRPAEATGAPTKPAAGPAPAAQIPKAK